MKRNNGSHCGAAPLLNFTPWSVPVRLEYFCWPLSAAQEALVPIIMSQNANHPLSLWKKKKKIKKKDKKCQYNICQKPKSHTCALMHPCIRVLHVKPTDDKDHSKHVYYSDVSTHLLSPNRKAVQHYKEKLTDKSDLNVYIWNYIQIQLIKNGLF